jgi:vesicle coat complex subunit
MSVQATLQKNASKISDDLFAPYYEAAKLLQDDNLIWDKDFDTIRNALALALRECATTKNLNPWFLEVAFRLIDTTRTNA